MYKLLTKNGAFGLKNIQNILKDFGIINPNIARNLRYPSSHQVPQTSMSKVCSTLLLILSPSTTTLPTVVPLLPTPASKLGKTPLS